MNVSFKSGFDSSLEEGPLYLDHTPYMISVYERDEAKRQITKCRLTSRHNSILHHRFNQERKDVKM